MLQNKNDSIIVEVPDPRGPWGARGVGELPFLPFAPAVLAAIHNTVGFWNNEMPATPERLWRAIRGKKQRSRTVPDTIE